MRDGPGSTAEPEDFEESQAVGEGSVPADVSTQVRCSIASALDIIGDRWTILILRDAFKGIRRFDELRRDLDIPRAVLSDRLKNLVEDGVLVKRRYQDRPERYEYRLSAKGRELSPILVALMQWGDRWLVPDGDPPTVLVHEPCGTEIRLSYYCWECGESFTPTEIVSQTRSHQ